MKAIIWVGASKDDLDAFPPDARHEAGYQLYRVQRAEEPFDWKPMASVGPGVREIRIHDDSGAFRIVYVAARAIYVLHCFQKKATRTPKRYLELARRRFKAIPKNWSNR
jgi:phage-related protein